MIFARSALTGQRKRELLHPLPLELRAGLHKNIGQNTGCRRRRTGLGFTICTSYTLIYQSHNL
jgi:hypothetical protein